MPSIKGKRTFKDTLNYLPMSDVIDQAVNFQFWDYYTLRQGSRMYITNATMSYYYFMEEYKEGETVTCIYANKYETPNFVDVPSRAKYVDFGEVEQTVSQTFYNWLMQNSISGWDNQVVINPGVWVLNDVLKPLPSKDLQYIAFRINSQTILWDESGEFYGIRMWAFSDFRLMYLRSESHPNTGGNLLFPFNEKTGWETVKYGKGIKRLIIDAEQPITKELYNWLFENATPHDTIPEDYCFCHIGAFKVKDADARAAIKYLTEQNEVFTGWATDEEIDAMFESDE